MGDRSYVTIHLITAGDPAPAPVEMLLEEYDLGHDDGYWYAEEMSLGLWSNTVTYNQDDPNYGKSLADLIIEADPTIAFCATQDGYNGDIGETVFYIPSLGIKHLNGSDVPMFSWQQIEAWLNADLSVEQMRLEAGEMHQAAWLELVKVDQIKQNEKRAASLEAEAARIRASLDNACIEAGDHLPKQDHRWQECPVYHQGEGSS